MKNIQEQIHAIPPEMGVYVFYDQNQKTLYVGKSKCLRKRVQNYFRTPPTDPRPFIPHLQQEIHHIEYTLTDTEKEALLLEQQLIQQLKPKYNLLFRYENGQIYLRLNPNHPFPRLEICRQIQKDKKLYFGPYLSRSDVRKILDIAKKYFLLRTCTNQEFRQRKYPCLQYQIQQCTAPCVGLENPKDYQKKVEEFLQLLKGQPHSLLQKLQDKMKLLAANLEFERAAKIRDAIASIQKLQEQQKVVLNSHKDLDIFAHATSPKGIALHVFYVRYGKILSAENIFCATQEKISTFLEAYLGHYYCKNVFVPEEILVDVLPASTLGLKALLKEKKGKSVPILCPKRGVKKQLIELCAKNASAQLQTMEKQYHSTVSTLEDLQRLLGLQNFPFRMEAYDISCIQGQHAVGAMITFELGKPLKNLYRHYKIRTVSQANDFAMIAEVLQRRLRSASTLELPNLIVIDGGKGQLNAALKVLENYAIQGVDIIALAKARKKHHNSSCLERVFLPNHPTPIPLQEGLETTHLLQRLRDEAHRFALAYHRMLRDRAKK
ncbi:MAG: excinuclease ABC subunit UvrC [Planctomycetota bacterium]|nr:MAG: excinuclease ABC subunit UvrC [Planctomycetota bacterium]